MQRFGQALVLCGIPALALIAFGPAAWHAARSVRIAEREHSAVSAAGPIGAAEPTGLVEWRDTDSPAVILVGQARRESTANNGAVRRLRALLLATQKPGTLEQALTVQSLLLAAAQRDAWDANWRQNGRRGANLRRLGASLLNLRIQFRAANASLRSLQAAERAAGSVFSFTPPVF